MEALVLEHLGVSVQALGWLALGASIAGVVRGFSGFGTAMIFLPFAGAVASPVWALSAMAAMEIVASGPMVRRMARSAEVGELARLGAAALVGLPLGVAVLVSLQVEMFRYSVSAITLVMVAVLALGLRFKARVSNLLVFGAGGLGGFLAGSVGLPGPPVILLYLARPLSTAAIRATLFCFMALADALLLAALGVIGLLEFEPLLAGVVVAVPFFAAMGAGAAMFSPERASTYRAAAYAIVAASAVIGLPLLD